MLARKASQWSGYSWQTLKQEVLVVLAVSRKLTWTPSMEQTVLSTEPSLSDVLISI